MILLACWLHFQSNRSLNVFQLTSYGGNLMFKLNSNLVENGSRRSKRYTRTTVSNYVRETPHNKSWTGNSHSPRGTNDVPRGRQNNPSSIVDVVSGPRHLNLTGGYRVFLVVRNL